MLQNRSYIPLRQTNCKELNPNVLNQQNNRYFILEKWSCGKCSSVAEVTTTSSTVSNPNNVFSHLALELSMRFDNILDTCGLHGYFMNNFLALIGQFLIFKRRSLLTLYLRTGRLHGNPV